jgi:hypothetical protein
MSNTLHLSGDKWELSGWSLSSLQPTVIVEVMHGSTTATQGRFSLNEDKSFTPWSSQKSIGGRNTARDQASRCGGTKLRAKSHQSVLQLPLFSNLVQ